MSKRRIWLDHQPQSRSFTIEGDAFHHAFRVSKFREGEIFEVIWGGDTALQVQAQQIGKDSAKVEVIDKRKLPISKLPQIGLALCVPKWPTWDWIIEKSVELGVSHIQPLISERSPLTHAKDFSLAKEERTQKIVRSALTQSGWGGLPRLYPVTDLKNWAQEINRTKDQCGLMAYEAESQDSPRAAFGKIPPGAQILWALVGPEGGITEAEAVYLKSCHFNSLSFGQAIMRTETACLTMLSVIRYELNLFS